LLTEVSARIFGSKFQAGGYNAGFMPSFQGTPFEELLQFVLAAAKINSHIFKFSISTLLR
jgi:hypothetical protein